MTQPRYKRSAEFLNYQQSKLWNRGLQRKQVYFLQDVYYKNMVLPAMKSL